ncbi:hypothetical protein C8F01DRAFT_1135111 [Mycena amicta]|nr:hypothetical protein C8F01DRAFT_1135111 [Mycena amicta]
MEDPRLPPELEREVCDLAASMHPETMPTLVRVAHRIREWTEPLLYQTVRVKRSKQFDAFLHVLRTKPLSFLAASVRHVHFESDPVCTFDLCVEIISKCPGITRLGTTQVFKGPASLAPLNTLRNVRHLAISLCPLLMHMPENSDLAVEPILANITHLSLHDDMRNPLTQQVVGSVLPRMPCLTHIRLIFYGLSVDAMRQLLSTCTQLEILLVTVETTRFKPRGYPIEDLRLVWGHSPDNYYVFWDDWQRGAWGLRDLWAFAEEAVEKRKRDPSSHSTSRIDWIRTSEGEDSSSDSDGSIEDFVYVAG